MLTQQQTIELIRPYYISLLTALSNAKKRLSLVDTERHALRKTTVANFFRDLSVDEMRKVFDGMQSQGISILDQRDGSFFVEFSGFQRGIDGAAWVRVKKVNSKFLTANIPTRKSSNFNLQKIIGYARQDYLEGIDWGKNPKILQPTHVNLGHQWDELGREIQDVVLTCPENNYSLAWIEKIGDREVMEMGVTDNDNVSEFPIRLEVSNKKPKRITAKSGEEKEKVKKDGTWS